MARVPVVSTDDEEIKDNDMAANEASQDDASQVDTSQLANPSLISRLIARKPAWLTPPTALISLVMIVLIASVLTLMGDRNRLEQRVEELSSGANAGNQANSQAEAEELKAKVGQFIELPADETPTVATVVDASKVSNQPFFARAKNGDKVLLFAKAGKAILYRVETNKIIEVAPINLGNNQADAAKQSQ